MDFSGKDKSQYVKETFNSIAGKYDTMNTLMSMGMDKRWRRKAVQICRARSGMAILDVCCGTGMLSEELAAAVAPNGLVTGIDFSENMLERAEENIKNSPYRENIKFIQGDAMSLPFADNSFDGATIGWGLRNLPDSAQGIREMTRVVKAGAMVVSVDMGKTSVPVFKQLYGFYFKRLVPMLGKIWAGGRDQYQYLYDSAAEFYSQAELVQIFQQCGLVDCGYHNLALGSIALVYGRKPVLA